MKYPLSIIGAELKDWGRGGSKVMVKEQDGYSQIYNNKDDDNDLDKWS
jgi:hypothetical protein